jgi:hypothetical protein
MAALAAVALMGLTGQAQAGVIERACLGSDRPAASRILCGCIQNVADLTLDRRDQRLAAKFFRDPHMAQEVRQSDKRSHEIFWQKYKKFGASAESYCG